MPSTRWDGEGHASQESRSTYLLGEWSGARCWRTTETTSEHYRVIILCLALFTRSKVPPTLHTMTCWTRIILKLIGFLHNKPPRCSVPPVLLVGSCPTSTVHLERKRRTEPEKVAGVDGGLDVGLKAWLDSSRRQTKHNPFTFLSKVF